MAFCSSCVLLTKCVCEEDSLPSNPSVRVCVAQSEPDMQYLSIISTLLLDTKSRSKSLPFALFVLFFVFLP